MTKFVSVIGNGESRRGFDITPLKSVTTMVGCNALFRDHNLEYVVAHPDEKNLDTKPYLEICSDDIRQYPNGDVYSFGHKSSKKDGTPKPKDVKVKRFF